MATVFSFGSSASSDTTGYAEDNNSGFIRARVDDGTVSVGDRVTVFGFSPDTINGSYIFSGGEAYYLGTATLIGQTAYIFGTEAVPTDNTALLALFDSATLPDGAGLELRTILSYPETMSFGSDPACFAAGTLISTPDGATTVEALRIGDLVFTADGRAVPVKWIGRKSIRKAFASPRDRAVRVAQGALGGGLPHADLVLTADHALILGDLAVNAGALVNGTTIRFVPAAEIPERYTWYHVETEAHEEILANGAPAETFVDYVRRSLFDNHQEYLDLYGAERIIPEMKRPRISTQRMLPAALRTQLGLPAYDAGIVAEANALLQRLKAA